MKCPHCLENFHDRVSVHFIAEDVDGAWAIENRHCPACRKLVLNLVKADPRRNSAGTCVSVDSEKVFLRIPIRPKGASRPPCPKEIPAHLANDYNKACLVIADSAKASAALSRRCLQTLLREAAGVKHSDLSKEIQEVLDSGKLPSDLAASIDAVRNIGNVAAHPLKDHHTGEIVDVEPGEAEWNLEVLESLFDFYYVRPALLQAKKDALNKKLADAGELANEVNSVSSAWNLRSRHFRSFLLGGCTGQVKVNGAPEILGLGGIF